MATRTATIVGLTLAHGFQAAANEDKLRTFHLYLYNNTSSTVIGGTDTLNIDVSSVIPARQHMGETVTLLDAHVAECADVAGTRYWGTVSLSSNTVQISPVAVSDYTSNATLPANTSVTNRPYMISVTVKVA